MFVQKLVTGDTPYAFCIEPGVPAGTTSNIRAYTTSALPDYVPSRPTISSLWDNNKRKVAWVAMNKDPYSTAAAEYWLQKFGFGSYADNAATGLMAGSIKAAVIGAYQAAIWHLAGNHVTTSRTTNNNDWPQNNDLFFKVYQYLVANARDVYPENAGLTVNIANNAKPAGTVLGPLTVTTTAPDVTVTGTIPSGVTLRTSAVPGQGTVITSGTVVNSGTSVYAHVDGATPPGTLNLTLNADGPLTYPVVFDAVNYQDMIEQVTGRTPLSTSVAFSWTAPLNTTISTTATLKGSTQKMVPVGSVLSDAITYVDADTNETYTITGSLWNVTDNADANVTSTVTHKPTTTNGSVAMDFTIPASLAGKKVVVLQTMKRANGTVAASALNKADPNETVTVPGLTTTATDNADGTKLIPGSGGTVKDVVAVNGVTPNQTYTLTGTLYDRATATSLGISTSLDITPSTENSTHALTFTVPASQAGKTVVVYQQLALKSTGQVLATHNLAGSDPQTVYMPKLSTTATDNADTDSSVPAGGKVKDVVAYSGLQPGVAYSLTGQLRNTTSGAAVGAPVTVGFTPATASGTQTLIFDVPSTAAGLTLVATESLRLSSTNKLVFDHNDLNDAAQTVTVPSITTQATDHTDALTTDTVIPSGGGTVRDVITYRGLTPGKAYSARGQLYTRNSDGTAGPAVGLLVNQGFTAAANGTVTLNHTVATTEAGKTLVAYAWIYDGAVPVASHTDIASTSQDVTVARITTVATDNADSDTSVAAGGTVKDVITYTGLDPAQQYTVRGQLMNKASSTTVGSEVSATFTPASPNGTYTMLLPIPAGQEGTSLVVYERLYDDRGSAVALHTDITAASQTVSVPRITTNAADDSDNDDYLPAAGGVVADTVSYSGLAPTTGYTLNATLMKRESNGTATPTTATASASFTSSASGVGSTVVKLAVPAGLEGATVVVYETLLDSGGRTVDTHADINAASQTVYVASMGTTASGTAGTTVASAGGTITDVIAYTNLVPGGSYTASGRLMRKNTDGTVTATTVTSTQNFIASGTGSGTTTVTFTLPAGFDGATLVVYEKLLVGATVIATHENPNATSQIVVVPTLGTTASDDADGDRFVPTGGTVRDVVTYTGLTPGIQYTLRGQLRAKTGGAAVGGVVAASFTPTSSSGTTTLTLPVPAGFEGATVVVFEELYAPNNTLLAAHTDLNDAAQTVFVSAIGTVATDKADGNKSVGDGGTITDQVNYRNLTPGTYLLKGQLINQTTGGTLGPELAQQVQATTATGSWLMDLPVPTGTDATTVVVYEKLYSADGTTLIASHTDRYDAAQTVSIPALATQARDAADLDQSVAAGGTVVDTVSFSGLTVGEQYRMEGRLVRRHPNGTMTDMGVSATASFQPATTSGTQAMSFTVPASAAGFTLVAFETLYDAGNRVVAVHADLNDAAQTVTVPSISTSLANAAGSKYVASSGVVYDQVTYTGLTPSSPYSLTATLMRRNADGSASATPSTVTVTFTASPSGAGTQPITIGLPAGYDGATLVAYEVLKDPGGRVVATHQNIAAASQTVYVAQVTTAVSGAGGLRLVPEGGGTVTDTVSYANLAVGSTYAVNGEVMEKKADGSVVSTGITGSASLTPASASGTVPVTFTLPAVVGGAPLPGRTFVVYERVTLGGATVATHQNPTDSLQIFTAPTISTQATDAADGDKFVASGGGTVTDTVTYAGVQPGQTYTLRGRLHRKSDGATVGAEVITTVTPNAPAGSTTMALPYPAGVDGATLVAFETLEYSPAVGPTVVLATHADLADAAQTVQVASVTTQARDAADLDSSVAPGGFVKDVVSYTGLAPGTTYTVRGQLMRRNADGTSAPLGAPVEQAVTPTTSTGTTELTLPLPSTGVEGATVVVFETILRGAAVVASHANINDPNQTVTVPSVGTVAQDAADGDSSVASTGNVKDTVTYTGLVGGASYTLKAQLAVAGTGVVVGTEVSESFTAHASGNGTATMTIPIPPGSAGATLVAFERLYDAGGRLVGSHQDPADAAQTVRVPSVTTTASDSADGDSAVAPGGRVSDVVTYTNLQPSQPYIVRAQLMERHADGTGTAVGAPVETSITSSATGSGSLRVELPVASNQRGATLVVFETLLDARGVVVATHADLNAATQTVTVPSVKTSATDKADGDRVLPGTGGTIRDTVTYSGLAPGVTYRIDGKLVRRSNGADTGITQSRTVVADPTGTGSIQLEFVVPAGYAGESLVVFEAISNAAGTVTLATHADLNDALQTVSVPSLGTSATDALDGDRYLAATGTINDVVRYTGLEPGAQYEIRGELVIKGQTNPDGSPKTSGITASRRFTPTSASGTETVTFTVPAGFAGLDLVAFEQLFTGEQLVGEHRDLHDASQTVSVAKVRTSAIDSVDRTRTLATSGGTLLDTVSFSGLATNRSYTLITEVVGRSAEGTEVPLGVSATTTFTPSAPTATTTASIPVPATGTAYPNGLGGMTLVVYETIKDGQTVVAQHRDLNDPAQTVTVPTVATHAVDADDEDSAVGGGGRVRDDVTLTGLTVGASYTCNGVLLNKATAQSTGVTATTTFIATGATQSVSLLFDVPVALAGTTLVAAETVVSASGRVLATHHDLNDAAQTVTVASIGTSAKDKADHNHVLPSSGGTITDTIAYTGLAGGKTYTVSGRLMNKATGAATAVTSSGSFTAHPSGTGSTTLDFTVPAGLGVATLVVFESVSDAGGRVVATHANLNDAAQTITVPTLGTVAKDAADGDSSVAPGGSVTDTVTYTGLTLGTLYTLRAQWFDQGAAQLIGTPVDTSFTASASNTTTVTLPVPADSAGKNLVAYERLLDAGGAVLATHEVPTSAPQTVTVPGLRTTATDALDSDRSVAPGGTVSDTVEYTGLAAGVQYRVEGQLMRRQADGSAASIGVAATTSFTPVAANGSVVLQFPVPADSTGATLVVFESLFDAGGRLVGQHANINDAQQTVWVPSLATTATDTADGDHSVAPTGQVTDTVIYTGLTVGKTYTLTAQWWDKNANALVGNPVTVPLTPTAAAGTTTITLPIPAGSVGKTLVAYEKLTETSGLLVAQHTNPADAAQTVTVPSISTSAVDAADGNKSVATGGTVRDTVTYTGLTPHVPYTLHAQLHTTSGPDEVAGGVVTTSFTPTQATGTTTVDLPVPAGFRGVSLVVYEKLLDAGARVVATHEVRTDPAQTVTVPGLTTNASDAADGDSSVPASGTVNDLVTYTGLTAGLSYTVKGELMVRTATGQAQPTGLTAQHTFTAAAGGNGTVTLSFPLGGTHAGATLVAYEKMFDAGGGLVAEHTDINDSKQAVAVPSLRTSASDQLDGNSVVAASGGTITDTVTYTGLEPGASYTLTGTVVQRVGAQPPLTSAPTTITGTTSFTASATGHGEAVVTLPVGNTQVGQTLVVFESLTDARGTVVATHQDLTDLHQTVTVPSLRTHAVDAADLDSLLPATGGVILDTVSYTGLTPGVDYQVTGTLMRKAAGTSTGITASATFRPTAPTGTVEVRFPVPSGYAGESLVAFEELRDANFVLIASHRDLNDAQQTVSVPGVRTTATDPADGDHTVGEIGTVNDAVQISGLIPGQTYTVKGWLVDRSTRAKVGNEVTTTVQGVAGTTTTTLSLPIPAGSVGASLVAFEEVYDARNVLVGDHQDPLDAAQTVTIPSLATRATDRADGDRSLTSTSVIRDVVSFTGLTPHHTYQLQARLFDKDANAVVGSTTTVDFTPTTANGTQIVDLSVPPTMEGRTLVVFETLLDNGAVLTRHENPTDAAQTVQVAGLTTRAVNAGGTNNSVGTGGTIRDAVTYTGLVGGATYTAQGELVSRATGEVAARGERTFTAGSGGTGTTSVDLVVPVGADGSSFVVFERVYDATGALVASHTDPNDPAQRINVPSLTTQALDATDSDKMVNPGTTVTDTVTFTGLAASRPYRLIGEVVNATTGSSLGVTGTRDFTAPASGNGSATVDITVPTASAGTSAVVFQRLYDEHNTLVTSHLSRTDPDQRFAIPGIRTTASDALDSDTSVPAGGTVLDEVTYAGLLPTRSYTLSGRLMQVNADGTATQQVGDVVTNTFSPASATGKETVRLPVPATAAGLTLVVYETLADATGTVIARHEDPTDSRQTVVVPSVTTRAYDVASGTTSDRSVAAGGTVADLVAYTGLTPGTTYRVATQLVQSPAGTVVASKDTTLTPTTADGTLTVTIPVPTGQEGNTLVVFQRLYQGATLAAAHADLGAASQTITVPKITTNATDPRDNDQVLPAAGGEIVDTVHYTGLNPGEQYTLEGTLMQVNGTTATPTPLTRSTSFLAEAGNHDVSLTMTVPPGYGGTTLVAYQKLYDAGRRLVAQHTDPRSPDQTITVAGITTNATDLSDGDRSVPASGGTIVDQVSYRGLAAGTSYILKSTLMDGKTSEALAPETFATFTAAASSGTHPVYLTVPSGLTGRTVVVFQRLYDASGQVLLADHLDILDAAQTVRIVSVGTLATDAADGDKVIPASGGTVQDVVSFTGLATDKDYLVKGWLVDASTGEATSIKAERRFTPVTADGEVTVTFAVPAGLAGTALVAFEELIEVASQKRVAEHKDRSSAAQTVRVASLKTQARDASDGDQRVGTRGEIVDTVRYQGLHTGATYTVRGRLFDKTANAVVGSLAEVPFRADAPNGEIKATFEVPPGSDGHTLVVYQQLLDQRGLLLVDHSDPQDADQTVTVAQMDTVATGPQGVRVIGTSATQVSDTVTYTGLTTGVTYLLTGTLMDPVSKQPVGSQVTTSFTATEPDGKLSVLFDVPAGPPGRTLVVFQTLATAGGEIIAHHHDFADPEQTVRTPGLGTQLAPATAGPVIPGSALTDTVTYSGLLPNTAYVAVGRVLPAASAGAPEHAQLPAGTTFTAGPVSTTDNPAARAAFTTDGTGKGTVELTYTVPATAVTGAWVAFAWVIDATSGVVTQHTDPAAASQKVTVQAPPSPPAAVPPPQSPPEPGPTPQPEQPVTDRPLPQKPPGPWLSTQAHDAADGDRVVEGGGTITDVASYGGLEGGKPHVMLGQLMTMEGATPVPVGDPVRHEFTPSSRTGTVTMRMPVPPQYAGRTLVVFEHVELADGTPVVAHADMRSAPQTLRVSPPPKAIEWVPPALRLPFTGVAAGLAYTAVVGGALLLLGLVLLLVARRRRRSQP